MSLALGDNRSSDWMAFCVRVVQVLVFLFIMQISISVRADEPPVPAGLDPGGIAVAVLGTGIDYTTQNIAVKLARDGEGDLIAWDFADGDTRPYAASGLSNRHAADLVNASDKIRLIIVKEQSGDPVAAGRMAAFTAQTPARMVYFPDAMQRKDWPFFKEAVALFKEHLFIVVGHDAQKAKLSTYANLVIAAPGPQQRPNENAVIALAQASQLLALKPSLSAADLKAAMQR